MLKAVTFDEFSYICPYSYSYEDECINNYYNCKHPKQEEFETSENGDNVGKCYCFSCPLGVEADQEDLTDKTIDWDGECECGDVGECEYLLVDVGKTATQEQKETMYNYEMYLHRYDEEWLKSHRKEE